METNCCIVGGGPAGMMVGLLLARNGIDVTILEKHEDFYRDFRGDTIHPSTLEIMHDLGILEEFLKLPHQVAMQLRGYIDDYEITVADFSKLKVVCPYIAFMPQWDFLNFLALQGSKYPNFKLLMNTAATDIVQKDGKVVGVTVNSMQGTIQIKSQLVIACDGRHSTIREAAKLSVIDIGAPMDVLWFKLPRKATDSSDTFAKFSAGRIMIMINRLDYWQCGFVVAKGQAAKMQNAPIDTFCKVIANLAPFLEDRVDVLSSWADIKLLTVKIDRLLQWYMPGLLCIGDAAHAMSPVGGVGINLAIQDAVATANILTAQLKSGSVKLEDLSAVQKRRELPMKIIQKMQVLVQNRVIKNVLNQSGTIKVPIILKLTQKVPFFRQCVGYIIGIGFRPEHPMSFK